MYIIEFSVLKWQGESVISRNTHRVERYKLEPPTTLNDIQAIIIPG